MIRWRVPIVLSALGGAGGVLLVIALGVTGWGPPGTAAYQGYERLNRLMAVALLFMAPGWLRLGQALRGPGRWTALVAFAGVLVMAMGTSAEFWLYTDLPYGGENMRQAAFGTVGTGGLLLDLSATATGIVLARARRGPRWAAGLMMLALPLDIAAFVLLGSPFVMAVVLALAAGYLSWINPGPQVA